ncbi:ATP-dependent RecD-like DNA helicase [Lactobacillus sp. PV037]|uniref:SF1B family DNA helicase RecD2 n=1 Tax=unclassified Lactobacillus TaxID=2620435 RepID=UPI00223FD671|nr:MULTISPECIES: ATP-dependent RecD-like DNA helicase [unclassified Lactobacillus]QNQ82443.1 ATP-dependent RecD-like DNA helicase [Lactobacillus sp. PV012]QNQ83443.1 ATP-dependent RecD-like DNA helicase [Lactobacillus sp. PV037]
MGTSKFTGKVNNIIYENTQNLFKILDVDIVGKLEGYSEDSIRVTGTFGEMQLESQYEFTGEIVVHPKFGQQFKVENYTQVLPREKDSLINYLSSTKFPGIGKKAAQKIIDELGSNALEILKENPIKISTLDLTSKQKETLRQGVQQMDSYAEVVLKLAKFGLNKRVANNIYKVFEGQSLNKIEENPYQLVSSIRGYSFAAADKIGHELGISLTDHRRIEGAILHVLQEAMTEKGDTYVSAKELLVKAADLIQIQDYEIIEASLKTLVLNEEIVVDEDSNIAIKKIYEVESEIADELKRIIKTRPEVQEYDDKTLEKVISKVEKELDISYDEIQKSAIKNALNNSISLLTGGPGTGKTTIINGIILSLKYLEKIPHASLYSDDPPVLLSAPTGRAAKRMAEVTGINAKTIHRLLGVGLEDKIEEYSEVNLLNGELLIIDEMSMVDMFLFKLLLKGIDSTKRIVFVGDQDQLPSVGAGNIFGDLISSQAFPTTRLTQIHRQGENSSIVKLAHAINQGKGAEVLFSKTNNYSFIPCPPDQIGSAIAQITTKAMSKFNKDDIQTLGAMYNGMSGITALNDLLQRVLNEEHLTGKKIEAHGETFRIGDRILQLKNNTPKDVFNGQIGKIIGIEEDKKEDCVVADFDGHEVSYSLRDLSEITRAYAITIHKSQGSEFPLVILALTMQNYMMLRRNLLYTGITRAAKNLVMIGEKRAYLKALETPGNDRATGLTSKIRRSLGLEEIKKDSSNKVKSTVENLEENYILTADIIKSHKIDPMIGMEGIKPNYQVR